MIPEQDDLLFDGAEEEEEELVPGVTYRLNYEDMTIEGVVDEIESLKQTIYCILQSERFACEIYSDNYGLERAEMIGQPLEFVFAETEEYIKEALMQDDRIIEVNNFEFTEQGNSLFVSFEVESDFGNFNMENGVGLNAG